MYFYYLKISPHICVSFRAMWNGQNTQQLLLDGCCEGNVNSSGVERKRRYIYKLVREQENIDTCKI